MNTGASSTSFGLADEAGDRASFAVIVPTYNGGDRLLAVIDAIAASRPGPAEMFIADDGSTDGSVGRVAERHPGVRVVRVGESPVGPSTARNRAAELASAPIVAFVDADVLVHPVTLDALIEPCTHRPGAVCVRMRCLGPAGHARASVQRRIVRRHFDAARDRLIANSHWVRSRLESDGVRVDGVVWNGVRDTAQRPPLTGPPTVCYAGRLVEKKGVDTLIEAVRIVRGTVPDARLLIAGDGPIRAALERESEEVGLGHAVRFLGHLDHGVMDAAFAGAWVQAAPSRREEPFGLVAAEAMMRGTAAIVSNTGGLSEQVIDGETGYHASPGDAASWARQLTRVLSDPDHAEALGAAGRRRALAEFTVDAMVDGIIEHYALTIAAYHASTPSRMAAGDLDG